jgi:hypothetical protein
VPAAAYLPAQAKTAPPVAVPAVQRVPMLNFFSGAFLCGCMASAVAGEFKSTVVIDVSAAGPNLSSASARMTRVLLLRLLR